MMTKSSVNYDGYLIKKRAFKNSSLIATFLTNDGQLLNVIIYHGQKKSLLLFNPYYLDVYIRDGLSLVNKLEPIGHCKPIIDKALFCALYINELVGRLATGIFDCVEVYDAYKNVIDKLSSCYSSDFEKYLRNFEFTFLKHLGYELDFKYDQYGVIIDSDKDYKLIPALGFVLGNNTVNNGAFTFKGKEILSIDLSKPLNKNSLKFLKIINRIRIDFLLEGKKLQSRELFIK